MLSIGAYAQQREPVSNVIVGTPNEKVSRPQETYPAAGTPNTETKAQTEEKSKIAFEKTTITDVPANNVVTDKTNDIVAPYPNVHKETYTRKSSEDVPVNYNGVKENYRKSADVKEENQPVYGGSSTNAQTITEADKNLSDAELNKKYPNRNTSTNAITPSAGTGSSVSDADLKNQTPVTNTNTFQPAKTQNQVADAELNKLKKK